MSWIEKINDLYRVKLREKLNPCFAKRRLREINDPKFTIISNNCWGAHVYRYFGIPYDSPTIGLYFFTNEYIKFLSDIKGYLTKKLVFIPSSQSKYFDILKKRNETNKIIGLLGDIEIVFLHYKTEEEAREKWTRRSARIHWDHLIVKMSEQNECSLEALQAFDKMQFKQKLVFTTKDYNLRSQVISYDYYGLDEVKNDTLHFRKFVNLIRLVNNDTDFRRNQRK